MSKWNKTTEVKPPLNEYVLCYCNKRYVVAKRIQKFDGELYHNGSYGIKADKIEAWSEIEKYES